MEVKTKAVQAVNGEEFAKDKSPAYIEAAFDLAEVADAEIDTVRKALLMHKPVDANDNDNGQSAREKRLNDAWKAESA